MNEYDVTLAGKLHYFTGGDKGSYYLNKTEVFFADDEQAKAAPLNINIALAVDSKGNVYPGDGYCVET